MRYYADAIRKYWTGKGRSTRREYWIFIGVNAAICWLLSVSGLWFLGFLYGLFIATPVGSITVRRLHDADRRGWWSLLVFVPAIGWLALTVLTVSPGTIGNNRFGPNPRGIQGR